MRNKNKWLAVLLAGTLCASNIVPVLAADNNSETNPVSTETPLPAETPESEILETEVPEAEVPETETPETETPEAEVPETETPETETPEAEEALTNDGWVSENGQWYYCERK